LFGGDMLMKVKQQGESWVNEARALDRSPQIDPALPHGLVCRRHRLTWMAQANGLLGDLRTMPQEVQQIAFDQGMILYIPSDEEAE
jgi:hypothetical protein